jgi:hypothetical protein
MHGDDVLAGDREREATTLRLRAAHLEGRLDTAELERRVERAQAARTRGELRALEADLPGRPPPATADLTSGVPWFPGRRPFNERKLLDTPFDEVREETLTYIVPPLEQAGYALIEDHGDRLVFSALDRRPPAARGPGDRITVRLRDTGDGRTLVHAHGIAPLAIRRAFAKLSD